MKKSIVNKTVSLSDTAAIFWHVFGGEKDFKRLYMAAAGWSEEDEKNNTNTLAQYASRWKNSVKIQKEINRVKLIYDKTVKQMQDIAYEEGRRSAFMEIDSGGEESSINIRAKGQVDYTNPEKQKEKLNEIINTARDSGEALDALKVIIQGQKNDQDAARQNKIQRFYTPLQCRDCPLYQEKKAALKK